MNDYLGNSVAWSALWGLVGYLVGKLEIYLRSRMKKGIMTDSVSKAATVSNKAETRKNKAETRKNKAEAQRRDRPGFRIYIFVAIVGALMTAQQVSFQVQQGQDAAASRQASLADDAQSRCLVEQVTEITKAFQARADINSRVSDNTEKVLSGITKKLAEQNLAGIQQVLDTYVLNAATLKRERSENPVPPFPNGKCEIE